MTTIVCFGDSVTQGVPHVHVTDTFPKLLERRLSQRADRSHRVVCLNAGVGGENTTEGLARLQGDVLDHAPGLVVVEFGLNDIRYEPDKTVAPEQFAANLRVINDKLVAEGATVVFTTPNPIINAYHTYSKQTDYYDRWGGCNGAVVEYAEIVRNVAAEVGALLCDVYGAFIAKAVEIEYRGGCADHSDLTCLAPYISTTDGVHPTALGQDLIASDLYKVIVLKDLLGS